MRETKRLSAPIQPRLLDLASLAEYLGITSNALAKRMPELRKLGFPDALSILGIHDRKAVDAWLDHISGLRDGQYGFYPPREFLIGSPRAPLLRREIGRAH